MKQSHNVSYFTSDIWWIVNKYAQHGYGVSIYKNEQHVILNEHIERLQPLEHF